MEINYALIGKRIRETRKQRGLSAEELAEIADLSTVYISYIENAKRKPSLESVSYTHLRAHETRHDLVCRLLLEKKKEIVCRLLLEKKKQMIHGEP